MILVVVVFFYLTDRPADATWLPAEGRTWLADPARAGAAPARRQRSTSPSLQALMNPRVLALSLVYFGAVACNYGVGFFLPQIVKGFGLDNLQTGFVTAIPFAVGVRRHHLLGQALRPACRSASCTPPSRCSSPARGILAASFLADPTLKMIALSVGAFGVFGCLPVFWTLPTAFLSGAAAAGGIAIDQRDRQPLRLLRPVSRWAT